MTIFQWISIPLLAVLSVYGFWTAAVRRRGRAASFASAVITFSGAISIFRPDLPARMAKWLGIGRGADLVLYCFCLLFLGLVIYFLNRFQSVEAALTSVVREAALRNAQRDYPEEGTSMCDPGC